MPRRESPLERDGSALVDFAVDLRLLRDKANAPTYRELARLTHYSASALSDAAGGKRLPSLAVTRAFVQACGGDEGEWEQRWHSLAAEERKATPELCEESGEPPYRGLPAYGVADADRFFGREKLVADLELRLARNRFLAVFGPSGSGKSSVLRAGLVPRLPGLVLLFTPGAHPLEELAVQLARAAGLSAPSVHGDLVARPDDVALLVRQLDGEPVLVVDQFEEVFTLCQDQEERERFLTVLLAARTSARVLIGVRADFYARCGVHAGLVEAMQDAMVTVGPMTPDELRRCIVQPARAAQCTVDNALVATLISEVHGHAGMLPLLSHALLETWRRRQGNALTTAAFQNAGGLQGALAQSADAVFDRFDEEEQEIARALFLRLSALGDGTEDTKRRVTMAEIDDAAATTSVLESLTAARLLTRTREGVEITHEALIRSWPRLRDWLAHDRDGQRLHRELTDAAATWERHGRDRGSLLRGARLEVLADWSWETKPPLNTTEQTFLDESVDADAEEYARTQRSARRSRTFLLLQGALALLIVVLLGMLTFRSYSDERAGTVSRANAAAMEAMQLTGTSPELAAHVALAGYQLDRSPTTRDALVQATAMATGGVVGEEGETVAVLPGPAFLRQDMTSGVVSAVFTNQAADTTRVPGLSEPLRGGAQASADLDRRFYATVDREQVVRLWSSGGELATLPGRFSSTEFGEDRTTLLTSGDTSTSLWSLTDPRAPRLLGTLPGGRGTLSTSDLLVTVEGAVIHVWDRANLSVPRLDITHPGGAPTSFGKLSGTPGLLLTGGATGEVRVWSLSDGTERKVVAAHTGPVTAIAGGGQRRWASTGDDGRIVVWDLFDKTAEYTGGKVVKMEFRDLTLLTVGESTLLRQWNFDPQRAAQLVCDGAVGLRASREQWNEYFDGWPHLTSPCPGNLVLSTTTARN
ncbi:nSTAND1 domain-containing NTPase [Lentzea flaviverrucosa]|uniref:Helix-turn-helix domain-containing protein n=1 Tax=Lentzea flaviverrucosa TaxID=200379 RepID=A0A1H9CU73_9PSEU|nr:helix-turn-helix domain-containing protein [Lentzea flaviverrucosa]RDI24634.1 helix-turn-helix protein [Lentzea flaviverrucosa]SEQ04128.1 Helix-turn-helix domain-containing protein [Lentzea flaviverrucosa]